MVTYNRQEVGKRLGCRRREMGLTGEEMGRRIGKNGRYYRDIPIIYNPIDAMNI
mgnify:CR=1 FL=1